MIATPSITDLCRRIQDGDEQAFEQVITHCSRIIHHFVNKEIPGVGAEDIKQEMIVALWQVVVPKWLEAEGADQEFGRFVITCMANVHRTLWAMATAKKRQIITDAQDIVLRSPPHSETPLKHLIRQEWMQGQLQRVAEAASPTAAQAVQMVADGYNQAEIDAVLGINTKQLLYRLRRKLGVKASQGKPVQKIAPDGAVTAYSSVQAAGEANGIPPSNITAACRRDGRTAGGFRWRYAKIETTTGETA